jgi:ELWxxDGT repeat protein
VTGFELWKSDGTSDGTVLVRDIDPTDVTAPSYFQAVGDLLYFTGHTPSFGFELWRSDGTTEGTVMVRNLNGTRSSYPESPANVDGTLFFYADDGRVGDELWAVPPPSASSTTSLPATTSLPPTTSSTTTSVPPTTMPTTTTSPDRPSTTSSSSAPTTSSLVVTSSAPATTSSAVSASTTTSTLPPSVEVCGNCLDDDGNGLTDLEDAACCARAGTFDLERVRIVPRRGRTGLALHGKLGGLDPATVLAGSQDVALQLRLVGRQPFCARIPATRVVTRERGLRFKDRRRAVASAGGITQLRVHVARNGVLELAAQGAATTLGVAGVGPLDVRVGFVTPGQSDSRSQCGAATSSVFVGKRRARVFGTR